MVLNGDFLKTRQNLTAFILLTLFWFAVVILTGTLNSGFHFTDDHGIITIHRLLKEKGFLSTCRIVIEEDLTIRFRSFYYLHRVFEVFFFGTNFLLWSVYNTILAIFTSFFLYLFVKLQGYKFFHALLFPLLTLIGAQSAIYWKLGPAETLGFFLLAASLYLLASSIFNKKRYQLILSLLFLILSSLTKESFILFIPAYLLLLIFFNTQIHPDKRIIDIIKSSGTVIGVLLAVLAAEIYIIKVFVGTKKIGYAGVDEHFSISKFIRFLCSELQNNYLYLILILPGILLLNQKIKRNTKPYVFNLLIFLSILVPQLLLYTKSGFSDRYLLPFILGFSIFIIFLLKKVHEHTELKPFLKKMFTGVILIVIIYLFKTETWHDGRKFSWNGKITNQFLSSLTGNYSTQRNDSILVVLDCYENYEMGYSINTYLTGVKKVENIFFYPVNTSSNNEFETSLVEKFKKDFTNNIATQLTNSFSAIAVLHFNTNKEIKNHLDMNYAYRKIDVDGYGFLTVYERK